MQLIKVFKTVIYASLLVMETSINVKVDDATPSSEYVHHGPEFKGMC